jgi:hypothetical protein
MNIMNENEGKSESKQEDSVIKSKEEVAVSEKAVRTAVIKKRRYYVMKEDDESDPWVATLIKKMKQLPTWEFIEKEKVKFQFNYVYPTLPGKGVFAHVIKTTPALKLNSGIDYIIEVSGSHWDMMDQNHREMLVEHELMHICLDYDKRGKPRMRTYKHDVEEFSAILHKYGMEYHDYLVTISSAVEERVADAKRKAKEAKKEEN